MESEQVEYMVFMKTVQWLICTLEIELNYKIDWTLYVLSSAY